MQATTTRLIKRIWEEFYSNYLPEDSKEAYIREVKVDLMLYKDKIQSFYLTFWCYYVIVDLIHSFFAIESLGLLQ